MADFSKRQWRALAEAYPFYPSGVVSVGSTAEYRALDCQAALTHNEIAVPPLSSSEYFVQYVVPRVAKVFPEELQAYERGGGYSDQRDNSNGDRLGPVSPWLATEAVDALLVYLFGCTTSALLPSSSTKQRRAFATTCFAPLITPLSRREQQLLGLYHRKQEQYTYVLSTQRQLLAASQLAVQTLQGASGPILADTPNDVSAPQRGAEESLVASTRESLVFAGSQKASSWPPLAHATVSGEGTSARILQASSSSRAPAASSVKGCEANSTFTSALANIPYEACPLGTSAAAVLLVDSPSVAGTWGDSTFRHARTGAASPLITMSCCAGCHEVGGDLLICTQCGEARHEACGGPHPPERSKVDGRMPTVNVCRRCAKELNLSSSSSSLRSSTSSSERAELGEYFSDDNDDSSLSGFVVNTSDDEEAEEEDDQSTDGDSSRNVNRARVDEKHERHVEKHWPGNASLSPWKGQHAGKDKRRGSAAAATVAPSEVMSTSSASSGSSRIWSRSASLDRALAVAAKKRHKKHGSLKKVHTDDGDYGVGGSAPRTEGRKGQRRKRHRENSEGEEDRRRPHKRKDPDDDASDASSSVRSASSASLSLSTEKVRRLKAGGKTASSYLHTSAQTPPSPLRKEHSRWVATPANREGRAHSPASRRSAEVLLAQPCRVMALEDEEELRTLGIAASSGSGSLLQPPLPSSKQRHGDIVNRSSGRRSVMNIASSSSSGDDSE
ncbi:hypothetical protein Q4I28_004831 [Leishmania naiffi]|uniref:Zinc finger PHD-type domain-containing protein n=1 Tax=Leishmania naiffi TaxID=5678 RepID=A0AAW3BP28_9TRYP